MVAVLVAVPVAVAVAVGVAMGGWSACYLGYRIGMASALGTCLESIRPCRVAFRHASYTLRHEVTPSLAMVSTANYIAAVGVPVLGGIVWVHFGYQVTFHVGAATCILSAFVARSMRTVSEEELSAPVVPVPV